MSEFQPDQRVGVREEGGILVLLDWRFLGKEGIIHYGTGKPYGPPTFYIVKFDSKVVFAISPDWFEPG